MKNYSHKIVNRVNSSLYKNSERLDNIDQHVAPGLKGKNQIGLSNNARIMPLSVDDLRTLDNPKTSYDGVTLESGMKGYLGKRKSELTRIKKKDFKEMKKEDLVRPKNSSQQNFTWSTKSKRYWKICIYGLCRYSRK